MVRDVDSESRTKGRDYVPQKGVKKIERSFVNEQRASLILCVLLETRPSVE